MSGFSDETTLKLHTAGDGCVWYVEGVGAPVNSGLPADEFMRQAVVTKRSTQLRLLGVARNVALIVELFKRKQSREIAGIQLAGPNGVVDHLDDPVFTLLYMRSLCVAPSRGGWHNMTLYDYATYMLMQHLQTDQTAPTFRTSLELYLRLHPVYKAFRFVPHNTFMAAALISMIVDPRWFVDHRAPDRSSKLELFLGLTPKTQQRVSDGQRLLTSPRQFRCSTVLTCWQNIDTPPVDTTAPNAFLWRIQQFAGGGWRGDLRASQTFVRYLRLHWLDSLDTRPGCKDSLFDPNRFFRTQDELDAYRAYMAVPNQDKV